MENREREDEEGPFCIMALLLLLLHSLQGNKQVGMTLSENYCNHAGP